MYFSDRVEAGRLLAHQLVRQRPNLAEEQPIVVGLPRGGVPVAFEVATALHAPLDVILVRKLGVPFQPELAMGAIGEDGVRVLNRDIMQASGVTDRDVALVEAVERTELQRRGHRYRGGRPRIPLRGRTVVIVDDGIATGATARAACRVARAEEARRVVVAVPVAPPGWTADLAPHADELVALATPSPFHGVGAWYLDFSPTTDAQVAESLALGRSQQPTTGAPGTHADLAVWPEVGSRGRRWTAGLP